MATGDQGSAKHRRVVAKREAEIQKQDVLQVEAQLDKNGLVEPEPGAQLLDILWRCASGLTSENRGSIAGASCRSRKFSTTTPRTTGTA